MKIVLTSLANCLRDPQSPSTTLWQTMLYKIHYLYNKNLKDAWWFYQQGYLIHSDLNPFKSQLSFLELLWLENSSMDRLMNVLLTPLVGWSLRWETHCLLQGSIPNSFQLWQDQWEFGLYRYNLGEPKINFHNTMSQESRISVKDRIQIINYNSIFT